MKTTTTANIGGISFVIDEDAYLSLDNYLKQIEAHLHDSDSKTEIMQDIEARIAELLQQHLQFSHMEVVNLAMINDIILQLGQPEVISDGFEAEETAVEDTTPKATETNEVKEETPKSSKKLYRDISNQLLGGVCSGIGKRIGIDAIWLRLIFAMLFFFFNGMGLVLYLLLWIIMPAANTTARRLEMNGIDPSAENIRLEVEKQAAEGKSLDNTRSTGSTLMLGCLGIMALPFILIFLFVVFILVMALIGVSAAAIPFASTLGITDAAIGSGLIFIICCLLAIFIPIGVLITWGIHRNKSDKALPSTFWIVALVLWLLSLLGIACGGIHVSKSVNEIDWQNAKQQLEEMTEGFNQTADSTLAGSDSTAQYEDFTESDVIEGELEITEPE